MSRQLGSLHRSNPTQPISKTQSQLYHFSLSPHLILQLLTYHLARVQTLTQILQFFIQFQNLTIQTLKLPTNLPTPNPLIPSIPKPTPRIFHNPLFNPSTPVSHYHSFPLPLMHPKSPQHILHPFLTDQPQIPQISHKFLQN